MHTPVVTSAGSISVLLFASYADAFGSRKVSAPISAPCRVSELVEALRTLPGGHRLPERPLVAVNRRWTSRDEQIAEGDEVAVIPPVAGG